MRNRRQEQLLSLLSERKGWMTSRQLGELLQVSDRTIRSDVDAINTRMVPPPIMSNVRRGYCLTEEARDCLPGQDKRSARSALPQTPGERCIYIIQKLLFEARELNLVLLREQIFVSGYSIDNDLKHIRRMLEPYPGLRLVRNRECLSLMGDEAGKRRFYRDLLVAEIQGNFLNMNLLAGLYKSFDLVAVKDIFGEVLKEYDYSIHESMLCMVLLHAGTSIERMNCSNYIHVENGDHGLWDTIEYQISQTFFERISKRLHILVQEGEVELFALVIMGKRASNYTSDFIKYQGKWLNAKKLVTEALEEIYSLFGLDFRMDEDLIAGLKMHIHSLIDRVKGKAHMQNIFMEDIKRNYPMVFEMGVYVVKMLEERLEAAVADAEAGYIALHLGAASERMNHVSKYRAMIIIPHNQSFCDLCVRKISDMFRERMEVAGVFSCFEEQQTLGLDPDLILTTYPLEHGLNIPTVLIHLFVDPETEAAILRAVNKLDKKHFRMEFNSHIGSLLRKEHFHESVDLEQPEDVIRLLCQGLEKEGIVEPSFKDVVLKREQMSPTSFVDVFAIPHAFGAFARNSSIAVAQLRHPVPWGCFEVRLVMLFAINEGDERMIKIFFDWVSSMVSHREELAKLAAPCCYEEFMDRLMG